MRSFRLRIDEACVLGLLVAALAPGVARAADRTVECRVAHEGADSVYADAGASRGVEAGDAGTIERDGAVIARVEVVQVTTSFSLLRVTSPVGAAIPQPGDRVVITVDEPVTPQAPGSGQEGARSPTLKRPGEEDEFVPLLAPEGGRLARAAASGSFHGDVYLRETVQSDLKDDRGYSITRLGTSGAYERMAGTPWGFEWAGDLSWRDGPGLEHSEDYHELRARFYRFTLYRRWREGTFVRLGRFLSRELPSAGYIDGVQGDLALGEHVRLGSAVGLRPDRRTLAPSGKEPTGLAYAALQAGRRGALRYTGVLGALGTLWEGEPDRLAVLFDQRADLGPRLSLFSSLETDLDVGGAKYRSGTTLTRLDAFATARVTDWLTLRAGVNHYDRPDTRAEREEIDILVEEIFEQGYWRYWGGSTVYLPWGFSIGEEVSYTESSATDNDIRWRATLAQRWLLGLPGGSWSLTVFNLVGPDATGLGGRFAMFVPLFGGRITAAPIVGLRIFDEEESGDDLDLVDVGMLIDWRPSDAWRAHAGVTTTRNDDTERYYWDFGLRYRW